MHWGKGKKQKTRPRRDKDWKCEFIDLLTMKKKSQPLTSRPGRFHLYSYWNRHYVNRQDYERKLLPCGSPESNNNYETGPDLTCNNISIFPVHHFID